MSEGEFFGRDVGGVNIFGEEVFDPIPGVGEPGDERAFESAGNCSDFLNRLCKHGRQVFVSYRERSARSIQDDKTRIKLLNLFSDKTHLCAGNANIAVVLERHGVELEDLGKTR